jgi:hypothetical protein
MAAAGILMSLSAIVSGERAFGQGKVAVVVMTLIGFVMLGIGLSRLLQE